MKTSKRQRRLILAAGGMVVLLGVSFAFFPILSTSLNAAPPFSNLRHRNACDYGLSGDGSPMMEAGGTWYWLRSPEEQKKVIVSLYNRYCIRCHGVDGRGVWNIPDVPDFTNARWQASRSDAQIARLTLQGRGACMPPFRGTLTLEEAWAMAHYLRTFVPGTEVSRPDLGPSK